MFLDSCCSNYADLYVATHGPLMWCFVLGVAFSDWVWSLQLAFHINLHHLQVYKNQNIIGLIQMPHV